MYLKLFFLILFVFCISFLNANILVNANVIGNNHPNIPILIPQPNISDVNSVNLKWLPTTDLENNSIMYYLNIYIPSKNLILAYSRDFNTLNNYYDNISVEKGLTYYWAVKACDNYYGDYNNCSSYSSEDHFSVYGSELNIDSSSGSGGSGANVVIYGCKDLLGKVCSKDQLCNEDLVTTYDSSSCCFGSCINQSDLGKLVDVNKNNIIRIAYSEINQVLSGSGIIFDKLDISNKRFALNNEVQYNLKLETKGILSLDGIVQYRNIVNIEIINKSNVDFKDLDLIVIVPKEFVSSYDKLNSDYTHALLSKDPIILRFYFSKLLKNEKEEVNYYFNTDINSEAIVEKAFLSLSGPQLLFKMDLNDSCYNIKCNTLDPCKISYCLNGDCEYSNKDDNVFCGENKYCYSGICKEKSQIIVSQKKNYFWFYIIVAFMLLIVFLLYYYKKKKESDNFDFINNRL